MTSELHAVELASGSRYLALARRSVVVIYLLILAWAPFPLGSAVSWGPGVLGILLAVCGWLWILANYNNSTALTLGRWALWVPAFGFILVLAWAFLQTLPIVPTSWQHPIWEMSRPLIGTHDGIISINAWSTRYEILKLAEAGMASWLTFSMAREVKNARLLFFGIIIIASLYAVYMMTLAVMSLSQAQLIYQIPVRNVFHSGPFMLHNSFATYTGLAVLASACWLGDTVSAKLGQRRWARRQVLLAAIQDVFGAASFPILCFMLLLSAVVLSASRAGSVSTVFGLIVMGVVALCQSGRKTSLSWFLWLLSGGIVLALALLLVFSGQQLVGRFNVLLDAGAADNVRLALWTATRHMIQSSPWVGLGLGTFQDAYPMYATDVFPYIMDKAHCDYLELAAGLGLPAAVLCLAVIGWLVFLCLRGVFVRKRNQIYPLLAVGAAALVALHSCVDFSLQIPAVALNYATILGMGLAQSFSSRDA